jgi:hypothetical protein
MPKSKVFNGKKYGLGWSQANGYRGISKTDAIRGAKRVRELEAYARVVKEKGSKNKYVVYIREKDD